MLVVAKFSDGLFGALGGLARLDTGISLRFLLGGGSFGHLEAVEGGSRAVMRRGRCSFRILALLGALGLLVLLCRLVLEEVDTEVEVLARVRLRSELDHVQRCRAHDGTTHSLVVMVEIVVDEGYPIDGDHASVDVVARELSLQVVIAGSADQVTLFDRISHLGNGGDNRLFQDLDGHVLGGPAVVREDVSHTGEAVVDQDGDANVGFGQLLCQSSSLILDA